jgi:hypothetical protein
MTVAYTNTVRRTFSSTGTWIATMSCHMGPSFKLRSGPRS